MKGLEYLNKLSYKAARGLKKNGSVILTVCGIAGVVATTISACKATTKIERLLNEEEEPDNLWVNYIPTAVIGTATIACIAGACVIGKNRERELISTCYLTSNAFKNYRGKLIELHGEETDVEVREAMARDCCDVHYVHTDVPDKKVTFYDPISGNSIRLFERDAMDAEYHVNRNYVMRGYATLNEFYEFVGLPQTEYGNAVGWSQSSGIMWIDFYHRPVKRDDGSIFYMIDMVFGPDESYLEDW